MTSQSSVLDEARECRATDPQRALALANQFISENPTDAYGYFSRHLTRSQLGDHEGALDDCNRSIALEGNFTSYMCRGKVHRDLGDNASALADFDFAHDMDADRWLHSFGPHLRADTHARLGNLDEALADAQLLSDDHWMPTHGGLPGGDKQQFIEEISRRAAVAKR